MRTFSIYFFIAIAVHGLCNADISKLPAEHRKALQEVSRFREIHTVTNLPPKVIALCADFNGRIADPGQKWLATDVITDDKLPRNRLIWAVTDGDYYVVHYERGGIVHNYHVLVVTLKPEDQKPRFMWRAVGRKLKDFRAFLDAIAKNETRPTIHVERPAAASAEQGILRTLCHSRCSIISFEHGL